jgi:hypothetical protein
MMLSLFNPWVILSLICAFLGFGYESYLTGIKHEENRQQLEIAALNAQARQREQALTSAVNITSTQLVKANNDAKLQTQKLHSALDSGSLKLRIPIKTTICPIRTTADTTPSAGDSGQATAELDRETAKDLISIADDGDKAIRQLNACIDAYNAIYNKVNEKN